MVEKVGRKAQQAQPSAVKSLFAHWKERSVALVSHPAAPLFVGASVATVAAAALLRTYLSSQAPVAEQPLLEKTIREICPLPKNPFDLIEPHKPAVSLPPALIPCVEEILVGNQTPWAEPKLPLPLEVPLGNLSLNIPQQNPVVPPLPAQEPVPSSETVALICGGIFLSVVTLMLAQACSPVQSSKESPLSPVRPRGRAPSSARDAFEGEQAPGSAVSIRTKDASTATSALSAASSGALETTDSWRRLVSAAKQSPKDTFVVSAQALPFCIGRHLQGGEMQLSGEQLLGLLRRFQSMANRGSHVTELLEGSSARSAQFLTATSAPGALASHTSQLLKPLPSTEGFGEDEVQALHSVSHPLLTSREDAHASSTTEESSVVLTQRVVELEERQTFLETLSPGQPTNRSDLLGSGTTAIVSANKDSLSSDWRDKQKARVAATNELEEELREYKKTPAYKIQVLATKNRGKGFNKSGGFVYAQEIAETIGKDLQEIRGALIQAQFQKCGYTIRGGFRGAYIARSDLVDFYNRYVEKILPDPVGEDQDLQTE